MAAKPLYLGPRLKRLRRDLGLTQADMASDLDISPSYVALIERNQRPLTADLLVRLASTYSIDVGSLAQKDGDELAQRLETAIKDPLFVDIDLPALDLADISVNYPAMAEAFLRLHQAFAASEIALAQNRDSDDPANRQQSVDPVAEARAFLASRRNCFPMLDDTAAALAAELPDIDAIVQRIARKYGVAVEFVEPKLISGAVRFHSYHHKRVFLNNRLDHPGRRFQLATQLAIFEQDEAITALVKEANFGSSDGENLGRRALQAYWAAAFLMPYRAFARAAKQMRHDLEALARTFGVSFEQASHRLTTLQRQGEEGVPFFFIRVDSAGNVSKRLDGAGFPFARHGGACPLWNVHEAFQRPGRILAQRIELPDGERFISIARTVTAGGGGFGAPHVTRAIALACDERHAPQLVYADAIDKDEKTPIGIACRFCHRPHCIARSSPPIGREINPETFRQAITPFAFADD